MSGVTKSLLMYFYRETSPSCCLQKDTYLPIPTGHLKMWETGTGKASRQSSCSSVETQTCSLAASWGTKLIQDHLISSSNRTIPGKLQWWPLTAWMAFQRQSRQVGRCKRTERADCHSQTACALKHQLLTKGQHHTKLKEEIQQGVPVR